MKYLGVNAATGPRSPVPALPAGNASLETAASPAKRTLPTATTAPTAPQAPAGGALGPTARPQRSAAAKRQSSAQQQASGSRPSSTSSANSAGTSSPATPKQVGLYGGLVIDANDYILATFSHRGRCTVHVHSPIDVPPRGSPQRASGLPSPQTTMTTTQTSGEQAAPGAGGESGGGELLYEIDSEADRLGMRAGGLAALQLPPVSNAAVMPNTIVASLLYVLDMNSSCIKVYRYRSDSSGR